MKKVLDLVKANVVIVIFVVISLVSMPVLMFFSAKQNTTLREKIEQEVQEDSWKIQQLSVTYTAPVLDPNSSPTPFTRPPNEPTTEAIRAYVKVLKKESDLIVELAQEHNKRERRILFGGLFPEPDPARETRIRQAAPRIRIEAHRQLINDVGAGQPPSSEFVTQLLQDRQADMLDRLASEGREEDPDERAQIRAKLSEMRRDLYVNKANDLAFYADDDVFTDITPWEQSFLPSIETIWGWQHQYWVHQDILDALVLANTVAFQTEPIGQAPLKRVEQISVVSWNLADAGTTASVGLNASGRMTPDYEASLSGRAGWPLRANPLYDVRYVDLSLIVSSEQLPTVLNAFSLVNFMTVLDVDLEEIDADAHYAQGYVYGPGHVVRARLLIETLWLRQWMAEYMPDSVKQILGIPLPGAPVETTIEQQAPPASRSRRDRSRG